MEALATLLLVLEAASDTYIFRPIVFSTGLQFLQFLQLISGLIVRVLTKVCSLMWKEKRDSGGTEELERSRLAELRTT